MSYIRSSVSNGVGEIVLDRPNALNALDKTMVDDLFRILTNWAGDSTIDLVLVTSVHDRAFCAGGDIRAVSAAAAADDVSTIYWYFDAEYELNRLVARYPKPYVAVIDGVAMGGGLGISVHGQFRVVTENAVFAMPETAIGFFPDVGSTYFLPRLPAGVGLWLGLTGARLRGADIVASRLATHYVPSVDLGELTEGLRQGIEVPKLLDRWAGSGPPARLDLDAIEEHFGDVPLTEIIDRLRNMTGVGWATEAVTLLNGASPTSLAVTARMIRLGASSTLEACFERELHAALQITRTHDFVEGVRAVLVDKDGAARFCPHRLADVDPDVVARIVG